VNAKCPNCDQVIQNVNLERGPIGNPAFGPLVTGYTAACPMCRAVLGVMPDPDSIADAVAKRLSKAR
jgi:hypothetical protein